MTNNCTNVPRRHKPPRTARSVRLLFGLLVLSLALPALAVYAQPPASAADEIITVRTDFITVPAVVTDAHGARVTGLMRTDFELRIDGRPVAIDYFTAGTPRVALLFALDASGSSYANVARQRETALALFARFGGNSHVAVLTFAEQPHLALPFTDAPEQTRAAFQVAAQPNQHTAIFDAALAAVRAFDESRLSATERRIVVLISDGLDTASTTRPADVLAEAQARGVTLYVIHLPLLTVAGGELVVRRPARGFRELGERTGGKYFRAGDARTALDARAAPDLAPLFQAIAADLASQYVLGVYPPADARAGEHSIQLALKAAAARKLRVRALRAGYNLKP
ncbi:MAG TPA: VWA domain-containing protein [Pyrinomonadaceae bacterium]